MYRIKDTNTGKYLAKQQYSYYPLSWTSKGRVFREIHHIRAAKGFSTE